MLRVAPLLVAFAVVSLSRPAAAQPAAQLYDDGLKAMLDGDYERGCPLLELSVEAEPLAGAVFTLAECYAKWGRHASAIKQYRRYLAMFVKLSPAARAKQKGRDGLATEQVGALQALVPKITVTAPDAPPGSALRLDGQPVAPDVEQMVDPGPHTAELELPSGEVISTQREVGDSEAITLTLAPAAPPSPVPTKPAPSDDGDFPFATVGWVGVGVGAGALIGGAIVGGLALGKTGTIDDNCIEERCNLTGLDAASNAQSLAQVSTVLFITGGIVAAAGLTLVLVAPGDDDEPSPELTATLGPAGGNLGMKVSW